MAFRGEVPAHPLARGVVTASFNASGEYVLTHDLGVVPVFVGLFHDSVGGQILLQPKNGSITTTQVTVIARTITGAAYTAGLALRWLVVG